MLTLAKYALRGPYHAATIVGVLVTAGVFFPLISANALLSLMISSTLVLVAAILVGLIILTQGSVSGLKAISVAIIGITLVATIVLKEPALGTSARYFGRAGAMVTDCYSGAIVENHEFAGGDAVGRCSAGGNRHRRTVFNLARNRGGVGTAGRGRRRTNAGEYAVRPGRNARKFADIYPLDCAISRFFRLYAGDLDYATGTLDSGQNCWFRRVQQGIPGDIAGETGGVGRRGNSDAGNLVKTGLDYQYSPGGDDRIHVPGHRRGACPDSREQKQAAVDCIVLRITINFPASRGPDYDCGLAGQLVDISQTEKYRRKLNEN